MNKLDLTKISRETYKGRHNQDLDSSISRLKKLNSYKELSTICIVPTNGLIPAKIAENWLNQTSQMNQKFVRLMMIGMEKYYAFNNCIENILQTPKLNEFKYILTLEEDTIIPPDGLHKLFESMDNYDVVGGLAFTKGIEGKPMVYGNPRGFFETMTKTSVFPETIQECRGIGTSYTMFKLDIFKNEKLKKPWFRSSPKLKLGETKNEEIDTDFYNELSKLGYKVACDTRVRLGKYDIATDTIW
jgi:hypothetical protein